MKVRLDTETIKLIDIFQNITGSHILDCIADEELYFVVAQGQYGLAVGKNGRKIRDAERILKKPIRVFEYSKNLEQFVRNMIPEANEIMIKKNEILVKIKQRDRAKVIGKGGRKIKIINRFLKRLHDIDNLKIK